MTTPKKPILDVLRDLLKHRTDDLGCYEFVLECWIEEAANEIERLQSRWIPVGERVPDLGSRVMVCNADDGWVAIGHRHLTGQLLHWDGDDDEELHEPTHWCHLPELPS
jgi:hypothetical protein